MNEAIDLELPNCTCEPLISYLKALGVLRLVAEQKDREARGYWRNGVFHLTSSLGRLELTGFLLDEYVPSPIVAPWGGASGFFPKPVAEALDAIANSVSERLRAYRDTVNAARELLAGHRLSEQPSGGRKSSLLRDCRALFPDAAVRWLDAVFVLTLDEQVFPPLFGSGGNDGHLDFSYTFMERLTQVIPMQEQWAHGRPEGRRRRRVPGQTPASASGHGGVSGGPSRGESEARLVASLFGEGEPLLLNAAVGQFHPGGVGGPNATTGFEGDSVVNPWDYVLMMEGALLFAGSAARRLGSAAGARPSFPFTVSASASGWGTISHREVERTREMWLPLWGRPASLAEVSHVLAEGRAELRYRAARTGLDFARSVASLGVDRGFSGFVRYGFMAGGRCGRVHLAVPMGTMDVRLDPHVGLLQELDPWLGRMRLAAAPEGARASLCTALRGIEDAAFEYCRRGGPNRLQDVLAAVGRAEMVISRSFGESPRWKRQEAQTGTSGRGNEVRVPPLPYLSPRWLRACDDGGSEFRVAAAVASIVNEDIGPIRLQLEPVDLSRKHPVWAQEPGRCVWGTGDLCRNLLAVLDRRCVEGQRANLASLPVEGKVRASLADVHAFIAGRTDDSRIAELVWALAAVKWSEFRGEIHSPVASGTADAPEIPRLYALLKLLFLPRGLAPEEGAQASTIRPEPAVLSRLRAGDAAAATGIAIRRLRASGLRPLGTDPRTPRPVPQFLCPDMLVPRVAAALLIPIWQERDLARSVLRLPESMEHTG